MGRGLGLEQAEENRKRKKILQEMEIGEKWAGNLHNRENGDKKVNRDAGVPSGHLFGRVTNPLAVDSATGWGNKKGG